MTEAAIRYNWTGVVSQGLDLSVWTDQTTWKRQYNWAISQGKVHTTHCRYKLIDMKTRCTQCVCTLCAHNCNCTYYRRRVEKNSLASVSVSTTHWPGNTHKHNKLTARTSQHDTLNVMCVTSEWHKHQAMIKCLSTRACLDPGFGSWSQVWIQKSGSRLLDTKIWIQVNPDVLIQISLQTNKTCIQNLYGKT